MTNQEMFNQKLKELGYDDMPEGILLIGEKKEELLEFINNNSKGGYSISADGKIDNEKFGQETQLDAILKKLQEEQKNIIMLVENLSNIEKDSPVVAYIDDSEKSRILVIDSTYFDENKLVIREYDGEKFELKENPALVDYIIKKMLKSNKPQIVPMGRDEINATATSATNVYAGPSSSTYASIGSISKDEGVVVVGESLGWYHIRYFITNSNQEKMGYVPKSLISTSVSTSEEDFYGAFAYAKSAIQVKSTQNFNDSVSGFGSLSIHEGLTLLYSYDYFGNRISFIEYSTINGTKRGYVYESDIVQPISNSSVARLTSKTNASGVPSTTNSASIGTIGVNELVAVLAKETDWLYVEYNTATNRKRAYIPDANVVHYHRPSRFPDFYKNRQNAYAIAREPIYAGPNTTYANIGTVNNEAIITCSTNDGGFNELTYVEYWITGSKNKKSGYMNPLSVSTEQPMENNALTELDQSYPYFGDKQYLGMSQMNREMYYYQAGSGENHAFLIFNQHGWEDGKKSDGSYYHGDGNMLVRLAKNFLERFRLDEQISSEDRTNILNKWTIFIFPCCNPDGIVNGWTNDGFGRCNVNGIDPNRNWPGNFVPRTSTESPTDKRNYTGETPLGALESVHLYDKLLEKRGNGKNVVLDIHGWENDFISRSKDLSEFFVDRLKTINSNFYFKQIYNSSDDKGYLISWAHNPVTQEELDNFADKKANTTNYPGIGATSAIIELPPTTNYEVDNIEAKYGLQLFNGIIDMLKKF